MKRVTMTVAIFLILAAGTALAASPAGQWNYKGYIWPDLKPGPEQGICFVADGTWYSTTFKGWGGQWIQDGDMLRFYGSTGIVSTAEFSQFISNARIAGEFAHFYPTPPVTTSSIGNFFMNKTSSTCDVAASSGYSAPEGDPAIK